MSVPSFGAITSDDTLTDQILGILSDRASRLAALLSDPLLLADLEDRVTQAAPRLAAILTSDDDHATAEAVADLYVLQHGDSDPAPHWWSTPLGRATAASIGAQDSSAVSASIAATMLGIGRSRANQLLKSGKLDRHPDGGVTRASVMARLAARA